MQEHVSSAALRGPFPGSSPFSIIQFPSVTYAVLFLACSLSEHVDKDDVRCRRMRAGKGKGGWELEMENLGTWVSISDSLLFDGPSQLVRSRPGIR